ncbi:MAG: DNA cytosine methyltransferase, partial [Planctomycetes bacterium]|nr:DNA cytosine methyltransferase [Planctomycetota bacterium]
MSTRNATQPTFIDLFSGCGGMSFGFHQAGFRPLLAIDHWSDALETYKLNNPKTSVLQADLMSLKATDIMHDIGTPTMIVGGPPCQGFSISGKRDPDDPRNILYRSFVDFVDVLRPKYFVMENVPNMASMEEGRILAAALDEFEALGYKVRSQILLASDFGVPQNRRRLFVVGVSAGDDFDFPTPTSLEIGSKVTTSQAISDLSETSLEDGAPYASEPLSGYQSAMRFNSKGVWNHQITNHSRKTVETIALVPDGGNYKNLPGHLQNTRRVNIAWTRYSSAKPSHTIDTGHRHHFHYKFNRIPTVRESARLQSFPDSFVFSNSRTSQYKQVGNAVPPLLAKAVGEQLMKL